MEKYKTEFKLKVVKSFLAGEGGVEALGRRKQGHPSMKSERRCPVLPSTVISDPAHALREVNERLRAEVAYLKKLQALIRAKRSVAPTKRA